MNLEQEKQSVAREALRFIHDGDIVGLGTGSTFNFLLAPLAERVRRGLKIKCIATSNQTAKAAAELGIPLTTLDEHQEINVDIDGADEIDPELSLIKGGGGAFLREKIVASAAKKLVIIGDSTKQVSLLGKAPVPVEVVPFAQALVAKEIRALGATVNLRNDKQGKVFVTDESHHILDCYFREIRNPSNLERQLEEIPGVVGHGLFIGMADVVLIGKGDQVIELRAKR
ncbi:MAG TPA: ribose-5-phosphate isomerase RpiA [Terriglobales bacterium]